MNTPSCDHDFCLPFQAAGPCCPKDNTFDCRLDATMALHRLRHMTRQGRGPRKMMDHAYLCCCGQFKLSASANTNNPKDRDTNAAAFGAMMQLLRNKAGQPA